MEVSPCFRAHIVCPETVFSEEKFNENNASTESMQFKTATNVIRTARKRCIFAIWNRACATLNNTCADSSVRKKGTRSLCNQQMFVSFRISVKLIAVHNDRCAVWALGTYMHTITSNNAKKITHGRKTVCR